MWWTVTGDGDDGACACACVGFVCAFEVMRCVGVCILPLPPPSLSPPIGVAGAQLAQCLLPAITSRLGHFRIARNEIM
jgi:hypothetical protein